MGKNGAPIICCRKKENLFLSSIQVCSRIRGQYCHVALPRGHLRASFPRSVVHRKVYESKLGLVYL